MGNKDTEDAARPDPSLVPRFRAIDGAGVERLLFDWLRRPALERVTLVTFSFDPRLKLGRQSTPKTEAFMFQELERLASVAAVTFVTAPPEGDAAKRKDRADDQLQRLGRAGATVLLHEKLHAKVFLLEEQDRSCWMVGSCNLTSTAMTTNDEVSVRGFHPQDFVEVRSEVERILEACVPL